MKFILRGGMNLSKGRVRITSVSSSSVISMVFEVSLEPVVSSSSDIVVWDGGISGVFLLIFTSFYNLYLIT